MGSSFRGPCAIRCSFSRACSNTRRVCVRWKSWPTPPVLVTSFWFVLAARVSVQPAVGRCGRRPLLPSRSHGGLWCLAGDCPPPAAHHADRPSLGRSSAGRRVLKNRSRTRLGARALTLAESTTVSADAGHWRCRAACPDSPPPGLSRRRELSPAYSHPTQPGGRAPSSGPPHLPRAARRAAPALPRGAGRSARGARLGHQCGDPLEYALHGCSAEPFAGGRGRRATGGYRTSQPVAVPTHQLSGALRLYLGGADRPWTASASVRSECPVRCGRIACLDRFSVPMIGMALSLEDLSAARRYATNPRMNPK